AVGELGLLVQKLRAIGVDPRQIYGRVDLGEQLPRLYGRTDFDVQFFELTGDLRADVDIITGLQSARRGDAVLDVAALHRRSGKTCFGVRSCRPVVPGIVTAACEQGEGDSRQYGA